MSRPSFLALVGALFLLSPSRAGAAGPPEETKKADAAKPADKKEAAERFDRGLSLFDEGDNAGALAEFKRTYEILPNPVVQYNIGLVYAAMGRPVDSVDALEPAVSGGGLSPSQLDRAKKTLADQQARIGRLMVTTKPDGASVEIDNVQVAKTPLTGPIRVSEGNHVVGAVAEGFAPARKEVVIAGNSDASVALELVPTQGKQLANLTIRTNTAGADVRVDNEPAGKTPLATSITLVAGHHQVELRRPGYSSAKREVDVGEGATGELSFDLAVDASALGTEGATLVLDVGQSGFDLTVDGEPKGIYSGPIRLPRGPHHLSIAAAGFLPFDRDVTLDPAEPNVVHAALEPTPETRADYESRAHFHRTWGWIGIASGVVIGGAGAVFLGVNASSKSSAQKNLNAAEAIQTIGTDPATRMDPTKVQHPCAIFAAPASDPANTDGSDACNAYVAGYQSKYDAAKSRDIIGFVGIGVGGAVAVTGLVLLLTGDDPNKYERPASRSLGKSRGPTLGFVPGPGQVGAGLGGTF